MRRVPISLLVCFLGFSACTDDKVVNPISTSPRTRDCHVLAEEISQRLDQARTDSEKLNCLAEVAKTLETASDPDLRYSLCIAVGILGSEVAETTKPILKRLYAHASDGGTHSAARWALLQQGTNQLELDQLITDKPATAGWYVNRQGLTMLMVPGRGIGPVDDGNKLASDVVIKRFDSFWLSDREVSVAQFRAFTDATDNTIRWEGEAKAFSPTPDRPVQKVSWFDAVEYCNWLSLLEGLSPFYTIRRDSQGRIKHVAFEQVGNGYRLPTEGEWEYACRAIGNDDFGGDTARLSQYAVVATPRTLTCGSKIPNGWGLFDMHGNVSEWCWDEYNENSRVFRGGSFYDEPERLQSAARGGIAPDKDDLTVGFRVARAPSRDARSDVSLGDQNTIHGLEAPTSNAFPAKNLPSIMFRDVGYFPRYIRAAFELRNPTSSRLIYRGRAPRSAGEINPAYFVQVVSNSSEQFELSATCDHGEYNVPFPADETAIFYISVPKMGPGDFFRVGVDLKLKSKRGGLARVWSDPIRWEDLQAK